MVRPATFALHIADGAGKPVENAQATGSFTMTLMDMGKTAVKFEPKGNGDYVATLPSFDMSGPWELTVDATQGTVHARKVFQVTVSD
jgi:nitrogen fixation protein FixH